MKTLRKETRTKIEYMNKKGGKCRVCNTKANYTELGKWHFHHVSSANKKSNISTLIWDHKYDEAEKELNKTILVCEDCHKTLHKAIGKVSTRKATYDYIKTM